MMDFIEYTWIISTSYFKIYVFVDVNLPCKTSQPGYLRP